MKSKWWMLILGAAFAVCVGLSLLLMLPGEKAAKAELWVNGELFKTVDLRVDQVIQIDSGYGTNTVTVENGKIAVTAASCPDHYCMQRGFCDSGASIVCLPNKLIIKFAGEQEVDGALG